MPQEKKKTILAVDDEPDLLESVRCILEGRYQVLTAADGIEALEKIRRSEPDLVLLDRMMPRMTGMELVREIKGDLDTCHLPVIMLSCRGDLEDRVTGLEEGADDYIVKPFAVAELLARVHTLLRRTERDIAANPLTRLPGNISIHTALENRLERGASFAVLYVDVDNFKAYNDQYGFDRGDLVIQETGKLLRRAAKERGSTGDFIGHIGGDDFVLVTGQERAEAVAARVIELFDEQTRGWYAEEDFQRGWIEEKNRRGELERFPVLTLSIGVVTNEAKDLCHVGEISAIGAELKRFAKTFERSIYVKDRRRVTAKNPAVTR